MIHITVRVAFLAILLALLAWSPSLGQAGRDEHQQERNALSADSKSDREHYSAGRSFSQEKRYEDATREFKRAISINSKNKLYYENLGFCLNKLGRYDEAIEVLNQGLSLDRKDSYTYRELGVCYCGKKQFEKAIDLLQQSISLNPSDEVGHRWLGYSFHQLQKYDAAIGALDEAIKLKINDFDAHYWRGLSLFKTNQFEEAARSLGKAVELRPNDFNANFWTGISLVRERKFKEAIPSFEKAHEIKPDDKAVRLELFGCYLATQRVRQAFEIFPFIVRAVGIGLIVVYFAGFTLLLAFSLPIRAAALPGFWFSIAWLALFVEGQIALFLLLPLLPWFGGSESTLMALALAGLPIVVVAATGFVRQPWGEPFRWPPRFGTLKVVLISLSLVFLTILMGAAFSQVYVQLTHKPFPLQRTIPLIKEALQANPVIAWVSVALLIPVVEEILFRGLLFGAFQKWWGITGAILGSAFVFACFHLQIIGFIHLFFVGLILGWARWQTRSLGLPIVIHSLNNATALVALTFLPRN